MFIKIEETDGLSKHNKEIEIDAEALIDLLRHGKAEFDGIIIRII